MRTALAVALAVALAAPLTGQTPAAPSLRLVPVGDTVLVYVLDPPAAGGFVVYRRLAAGPAAGAPTAFDRRSAAPVTSATDPAVLAGRLGADLPVALRAVRATDPDELLRRLRGDPFAEAVLSMVSRRAADALGRLYVDVGAARGTDYEYRIVFTGPDAKETTRSAVGRVHVADAPPVAPTGLKVAGTDGQVRLTWAYPSYQGAPTDNTVGFHVYRSAGGGPPRRLTAVPILRNDARGAELGYTDQDVAGRGEVYSYQVTAVDLAGRESALTAPVTARLVDHTPPGIPLDLAVRNGSAIVDVTWRMSPELDAAGYHIERSTGLNRPYARLDHALIPVGRPLWTDSVAGGRQYFYRVIAVDSTGNASAPSNPVSANPRDDTPPPPPTGLVLTTARHRIVARWAPVSAKDLRGYYGYHVEGRDRTRVTGRPLDSPQFSDSGPVGRGLTPGHAYTIRVTALDSNFNESPPVEGRILVPDDEPPAPPSAFSVQNIEGRFVALSWSASGSVDVQAYVVRRSGGPADTGALAMHRFPAAARSWRDTAVIHGRRYTYRLTAVDSAGNVSAARADSVAFRDFVPPPPPRAAGARAIPHGVEVRWERVVSLELAGYNVYRASLPTGSYRKLTRAPVSLLAFTDSTGHAGFYYRVRAVDKSGNESSPSPAAPVTTR